MKPSSINPYHHAPYTHHSVGFPLSGQEVAVAAFAGAALLVTALSVLQLLGIIATMGALAGLALAAFYYFTIKPILAMDFDISPTNEELAQILDELWD